MKTILVTGGTDGIGKGIATHYLKKGDRVIVIGSSAAKGNLFLSEAKQLGAEERAIFLQADLSSVKENKRIIEEVKSRLHSLDMVVFSATSHKIKKEYTETQEGLEFNFGLSYMSRFVLSFGFKELLEKSDIPIIVNVCAPGMNGTVDLNDIQNKNNYNGSKARYHGSRLNDLLGVAFVDMDTVRKIKYVLFNPWAVQTTGMLETIENPVNKLFTKLIFKIIGKPVDQAIIPIIELLDKPPEPNLTAYIQRKEVSLTKKTFNRENAQQLYKNTVQLLEVVMEK
ncbi:SDR family NAD(P)-dependent oxidoreductase [Paenibacillus albiflavus]|uniref:SDR family NAD(P)-dependent oxidoreductase n=1 Tax=Paenibacillus albiflavus TaxID=2545760 RepID=A0A4R4EM47_9BACL|nr:SDR family NAD(P)-dependent oxidoreductase [Paenibacillus albiflavus]TCZ79398.1 SDR family NAD(P)-dependent oxidoreductase [Paenibacillus albiflavus]